jgi:hypothetical protein
MARRDTVRVEVAAEEIRAQGRCGRGLGYSRVARLVRAALPLGAGAESIVGIVYFLRTTSASTRPCCLSLLEDPGRWARARAVGI